MKRIVVLLLALCLVLGLAACGSEETKPAATGGETAAPTLADGQKEYRVSVADATGAPYTEGVIVRFMQGGTQASMQVVNEEGVAVKALPAGEYTVELQFTDKDVAFHYDQENLTLTADKTELTVTLAKGVSGDASRLHALSLLTEEFEDHEAYAVEVGCTYVELTASERNYFLFTPTESGNYQFSATDADAVVGYFGAPHFVQQLNAGEETEKGVTVSVRPDMISTGNTGTAVLVIGVDAAEGMTSTTLVVERIGEYVKTISDEPWTEVATTHTPTPFTFPGGTLTYVDINEPDASKYEIVKGGDGNYHLGTADGPILYVNLGKDSPVESLQVIIQGSGSFGGAPIRKYFYDENKEFVKKEDYTNILTTYFENMDQDVGVYPLNDDLIYMIQQGCGGWWDETSPDYIFDGCNPELGWMFAVCYVK